MSPGSTLRIVTGPRSGTSVRSASRPEMRMPISLASSPSWRITSSASKSCSLAELRQAFLSLRRELGSKPRMIEHGDDRGVVVHCVRCMPVAVAPGECHQVGEGGPFGPVAGGNAAWRDAVDCTGSLGSGVASRWSPAASRRGTERERPASSSRRHRRDRVLTRVSPAAVGATISHAGRTPPGPRSPPASRADPPSHPSHVARAFREHAGPPTPSPASSPTSVLSGSPSPRIGRVRRGGRPGSSTTPRMNGIPVTVQVCPGSRDPAGVRHRASTTPLRQQPLRAQDRFLRGRVHAPGDDGPGGRIERQTGGIVMAGPGVVVDDLGQAGRNPDEADNGSSPLPVDIRSGCRTTVTVTFDNSAWRAGRTRLASGRLPRLAAVVEIIPATGVSMCWSKGSACHRLAGHRSHADYDLPSTASIPRTR